MPEIGDKAIFIEHAVLCRDLDSLMEQPILVTVIATHADPEIRAVELAKKDNGLSADSTNALALSGNTLEYEYLQPTGKQVQAVWGVVRLGWIKPQEIAERTFDITSYYKMD